MQEGELPAPKEELSSFFQDIQLLGLSGKPELDLESFSDKDKLLSFEGAEHIEPLDGQRQRLSEEEESVPLDLEDLLLLSHPESSMRSQRARTSDGLKHSVFLLSEKKLQVEPVTATTRVTEEDKDDENLGEEEEATEHSNLPKEIEPRSVTSHKSMDSRHKIASTRLSGDEDDDEEDFEFEKYPKDVDFNSFERILAGGGEESEMAPSSSIFDTLLEKPTHDEEVSIRISSQEALNMNSLSELVESMEHLIGDVPVKDICTLPLDESEQSPERQSQTTPAPPVPILPTRARVSLLMTNSPLHLAQRPPNRVHFQWLDFFSEPFLAHSCSNGISNKKPVRVQPAPVSDERPRHYRGNSFGLNSGGGAEFKRVLRIHTVAEQEEQHRPNDDSMSQVEPAQATTNSTLFNESRISERVVPESKFDTITEIMEHATPPVSNPLTQNEMSTLVDVLRQENARLTAELEQSTETAERAQLSQQLLLQCFKAFYSALQFATPFETMIQDLHPLSPDALPQLEAKLKAIAAQGVNQIKDAAAWEERKTYERRIALGKQNTQSEENVGKQEAKRSVRMKNTSQYLLPQGTMKAAKRVAAQIKRTENNNMGLKPRSEPQQSPAKNTLSEYLNSSAQRRKTRSPPTRNTLDRPRSAYQQFVLGASASAQGLSKHQKKYVSDLRRSPDVFKDSVESVKRVASFAGRLVGGGGGGQAGGGGRAYGMVQVERQREKSRHRDKQDWEQDRSFERDLKSALKGRLRGSSISRQLEFE